MRNVVTQYAKRDGMHIAYQVFGDGPSDLVLVPNWLSNVEANWDLTEFATYLQELGKFSRTIVFDQIGVGLSDRRVDHPQTLESWAEDLRAVLDAVGSRRAAISCFDSSGSVGIFFAATYPEMVTHLVLNNCYARFLRAHDYPAGLPVEMKEPFLQALSSVWGSITTLPVTAPSAAGDEQLISEWARYERIILSPGDLWDIFSVQFDLDVRDVLPSIQVPTLVLHSKGDRYIRVGHGRYLADHISDAKLVEIESDDHFFWVRDYDRLFLDETQEFVTGARSLQETNRVLTTLLFTDIVDSTRRVAELGDRTWRDLLERHRDTVRRQLERHRGREVDTAGDGFLATFDGPARAIHCASAIVQESRVIGIDIRAGLHTGEVEQTGEAIAGIAVHVGARVSALAGPGEILVSSTVKDLVTGSGIEFDDRGAHALKGVPGEWRLFTVLR